MDNRKKRNTLILVGLLVGCFFIIGVSYAVWQMTLTQTDKNTVTTSCFKLDFQEENDIQLENAYPITDEEGKVLTPYTFTITSLCETNAKYQINLEILNETTLEDVSILKVMLDDKINLLSDKTIVTPTLDNAKSSYLLKTGYLRNGESKTFLLRLWMDEDTPPNSEYMNKAFLSKVTITASYLDNLENTIASNVTSLNTGYDISETFSVHLTSAKYDIVSISDDGSAFEDLEEQGKDVTLEKIINTNGSHTLFVKDEAGNISEVLLNATKVDDKKPVARMNVTKKDNEIMIDASTSSDEETEVTKYYFSRDNEHFYESNTSSYTFINDYHYGKATEVLTNYFNNEIKQVYAKVEDKKGNVSDVISYEISSDFAYDDTTDNNLRYIGASPNNYIDIGDRDSEGNVIPWRIIGVMNNVDDGDGNKRSRLKVIRSEGIGSFSWDTSTSGINNNAGINEWSQADLIRLLNPGYGDESVDGSLYWNRANGICYNGQNNATTACDFTSCGLYEATKKVFGTTLWHTGSNGIEATYNDIKTSKFYELEQSRNTGKICTSGIMCNDTVERTTTWTGMIGLMYPSDYGYATKGGVTTNREACLNTNLFNWDGSGVSDCKTNDWLYNSSTWQWTLMPFAYSSFAHDVFRINSTGNVDDNSAYVAGLVRPVSYLLSSVKITDGDGSVNNMFKVEV